MIFSCHGWYNSGNDNYLQISYSWPENKCLPTKYYCWAPQPGAVNLANLLAIRRDMHEKFIITNTVKTKCHEYFYVPFIFIFYPCVYFFYFSFFLYFYLIFFLQTSINSFGINFLVTNRGNHAYYLISSCLICIVFCPKYD